MKIVFAVKNRKICAQRNVIVIDLFFEIFSGIKNTIEPVDKNARAEIASYTVCIHIAERVRLHENTRI